jgi:hypothetical protein
MWWYRKQDPEVLKARLVAEALAEMGMGSPPRHAGFWNWLTDKCLGGGQVLCLLVVAGLVFARAPLALLEASYGAYLLAGIALLWIESNYELTRRLRKSCPLHGTRLLLKSGYNYGFWNAPFTTMMPGYFQAKKTLFPYHFPYDTQPSRGMHRVYCRHCPACDLALTEFNQAVREAGDKAMLPAQMSSAPSASE